MAPSASTGKPKAKKTAPVDPFFGSRSISGLNIHFFEEFLVEKDVALVMFYDPSEPMCEWSKKHFLKAAKTTVRDNSAFAAVDCTREGELCENEGVFSVPYFKLYSKAKQMATYNQPQSFTYHTMKAFMENAPVLEDPPKAQRPC